MSTIKDVVKLKSGYANFVELKSAYEEAKENADRMAMYRPTKAHRQAFERVCRGIYQPNVKKFYLLSGSSRLSAGCGYAQGSHMPDLAELRIRRGRNYS